MHLMSQSHLTNQVTANGVDACEPINGEGHEAPWSAGMMNSPGRIFIAFCLLVGVWITVYWVYEPAEPAGITFDQSSNTSPQESPRGNPVVDDPPGLVEPRQPVVDRGVEQPRDGEVEQLPTGIIAPEFKDYVIQDGDTFESIAKREFGSTTFASRIAKSNPLKDPMRLRAGQVIRVPLDPDNIQGRLADSAQGTALDAAPTDQTVEYVIKKGDTLSEIAEAFYGSSRYVDFIFESNRERLGLKAQNEIGIGQLLLLPPNPPHD